MKIVKLNIVEFGCLKNTEIAVTDGINILSGDNESGKSTVMLFIRFMLYGLPKKSIKNCDRARCLSFDGHRAAGSMTLMHDGKAYRIERSAVGTTKISETLSVLCLDTGESVKGEPHELFLGVPSEVFESSCSVAQMRAADISRAEAANAVENLMVSADESIDIKKALEKLDKVRREYKLNKGEGGLIYKTQTEINELSAKKRAATERYVRFNEQKARLERKERDLALTQSELSDNETALEKIRGAQTLERFARLDASRQALLKNKQELSLLENEFGKASFVPDEAHVFSLRSAIGELASADTALGEAEKACITSENDNFDNALADVGAKVESEGGLAATLQAANGAEKKRRASLSLGAVFACIGAALAIVSVITMPELSSLICGAIAALGVFVSVVSFVSGVGAKKRRDAVCGEYGKSFPELEAYLCECLDHLARQRKAEERLIEARVRRDAAREAVEKAREKLASLVALTNDKDFEAQSLLLDAANTEIQRVELFCARRNEINKQIYTLRALCENDAAALAEYDEDQLRAFVGETMPSTDAASIAATEKAVKFNKAKLAALSTEVHTLREAQAALGAGLYDDPVELGDKIIALEKKLARDTEYFEALMLAKESLERASASMSGSFTPEISRRAGEMLSLISDGRHSSAQTNKNLDLNVEQDGFSFSAEMLSGGTRDAAYVCLRIALMIKLFGAQLPPLMLDEAMCQLDDGRVKTMLSLIARLREEIGLQTIVFTCHTREIEMCEQLGIEVNSIKMCD